MTPTPLGRTAMRYAIAVAAVAVALAIRWSIVPLMGTSAVLPPRAPYFVFCLATIAIAHWAGRGPAIVTALLGGLAADYFFMPPGWGFADWQGSNVIWTVLYLSVSAAFIAALEAQQNMRTRAESTLVQLRGNQDAFQKVYEQQRDSEARYRQLAEDAEANRRELESLINSMHDGLVVVDSSGNPLMMNPAALELHGYRNASEARGELAKVADLFELRDAHGNFLPPERWPGSRALAGEAVTNLEVEVLRRDTGKRFVGYYNTVPVRNPAGEIERVVLTITDITEHKRMEQRLRDSQKLESLGLLAGGIAHDFNNLLVAIMGNASLAESTLPSETSQEALSFLQEIVKAGEKAGLLTRQMLAYAGKGQFVLDLVDLSAVAGDMSELLRSSISKKIVLHLALEPDLPAVEADPSQIQQILLNLVINAAEAIGEEAGVIVVTTGVRSLDEAAIQRELEHAEIGAGRYVYLEVRDNGCGIDEATRSRIFEPFYSTKFTGRGLGLAAVAGIVRANKGAIKVTSTPGQGSSFVVLLPAASVPAPRPLRAPSDERDLSGTGTILFVDDEEMVRRIAKAALEKYGYEVLLAESGQSAIDLFRRESNRVSLVILDLSMPGMSGQDALPELRKIAPAMEILISSGYNEPETMQLFAGNRVSGFIQKPYTSDQLAERIKAVLGAAGG